MNRAKGIALVILSAVIYGGTPSMVKYTYAHGSNPVMMTMFRSLLPLPIILMILLIKKIPVKIPAKMLGKISVIALAGSTATTIMLNMSYHYIPVGMATTLHFVYPTFVSLLCFFFYKERIDRAKILALFISSAGILCFFQGGAGGSLAGILLALSSGLTYAFYMVAVDQWGMKDMHPMVFSLYEPGHLWDELSVLGLHLYRRGFGVYRGQRFFAGGHSLYRRFYLGHFKHVRTDYKRCVRCADPARKPVRHEAFGLWTDSVRRLSADQKAYGNCIIGSSNQYSLLFMMWSAHSCSLPNVEISP